MASGGMEVDPEAIQAFASFMADAKQQFDNVAARFGEPNATAESFGRTWQGDGAEYVKSWGMLGPDLTKLSSLFDQIAAQLGASADLNIAGETASVGEFTKIEASADGGTPPSESGGA
ncbi:MAG: hypothetical protein WBA97_15550 [Actinophytocola sp.]|uniref:WXG100 family type VII secretion target n=1 Tax=Actinophytocola sp. TaxID=1872138 RepID=UPI003C74901C